ncbi:hypothetical protein WA158_002818 [Blastocystis sp. Blastoise]
MSESKSDWNDFLKNTKISEFIPSPPLDLLEIDEEMNAYDAVMLLHSHGFFSAPVKRHNVDEALPCSEKYIGVLSPHDILSCFIKCAVDTKLYVVEEDIEEGDKHTEKDEHAISKIDKMKEYKVKDIVGSCPFVYINSDTSVYECIKIITERRAFRLCVVDHETGSHIVDFISKTKIEMILYPFLHNYPSISNLSLKQLSLTQPQQVLTLERHHITFEAFQLLSSNAIGGIPIVDNIGSLVGRISVKDIYHIMASLSIYQTIKLPIGKYLEKREFDLGVKVSSDAIICHETDTIEMLINTYITDSTNRVFLVNENKIPIRCITLFDLLKAFIE